MWFWNFSTLGVRDIEIWIVFVIGNLSKFKKWFHKEKLVG